MATPGFKVWVSVPVGPVKVISCLKVSIKFCDGGQGGVKVLAAFLPTFMVITADLPVVLPPPLTPVGL